MSGSLALGACGTTRRCARHGNSLADGEAIEHRSYTAAQDVDKLKQAKEETYVKGFYEGVMEVRGSCAPLPQSRGIRS